MSCNAFDASLCRRAKTTGAAITGPTGSSGQVDSGGIIGTKPIEGNISASRTDKGPKRRTFGGQQAVGGPGTALLFVLAVSFGPIEPFPCANRELGVDVFRM